jgi:hypothetical protein
MQWWATEQEKTSEFVDFTQDKSILQADLKLNFL